MFKCWTNLPNLPKYKYVQINKNALQFCSKLSKFYLIQMKNSYNKFLYLDINAVKYKLTLLQYLISKYKNT